MVDQRRLTPETLDAVFRRWWEAGGHPSGAAAKSAARRRGDPEPAEHTEPHRCRYVAGRPVIEPVEEGDGG